MELQKNKFYLPMFVFKELCDVKLIFIFKNIICVIYDRRTHARMLNETYNPYLALCMYSYSEWCNQTYSFRNKDLGGNWIVM